MTSCSEGASALLCRSQDSLEEGEDRIRMMVVRMATPPSLGPREVERTFLLLLPSQGPVLEAITTRVLREGFKKKPSNL